MLNENYVSWSSTCSFITSSISIQPVEYAKSDKQSTVR